MDKKQNRNSGVLHFGLWLTLMYACGLYIRSKTGYNFSTLMEYLSFKPKEILDGEVTRLFTWLLVPAGVNGGSFIYAIVKLPLLLFSGFLFGWLFGRVKYNFFLFRGLLITLLCGFAFYGSAFIWSNKQGAWDLSSMYISDKFSSIYVLMSSLLMVGFLLIRKNLRNYTPNLIIGIVCIVVYSGMVIYEMISTYLFSKDGFVVVCIVLAASMVNVFVSLIRVQKITGHGEILNSEGLMGFTIFRKEESA